MTIRRKRKTIFRPVLTLPQILAWIDDHHQRCGKYPNALSGSVAPIDAPLGCNWKRIDNALRLGSFGLPGEMSLASVLQDFRGVRNKVRPPALSDELVLAWAEAYNAANGRWPTEDSGPVADAPGETWSGVNAALREGARQLTGRRSLAKLIAKERGARNKTNTPSLTMERILRMAELHRKRTGRWPKVHDGKVLGYPGENWLAINGALARGARGLPGGSSLAEVLRIHRGQRNKSNLPRLTEAEVLQWAEAHKARTGKRPSRNSGPIFDEPSESWHAVDLALAQGLRGFPGGDSLARLLNRQA